MISDFLDAERVVERLRSGPAGLYVDDFATWLRAAGYQRTAGRGLIRGLERFANWVRRTGLDLGKIDSDTVVRYHKYLASIGRRTHRCGKQTEDVTSSRRFLSFLSQRGDRSEGHVDSDRTESSWVGKFREWMLNHRGVRQSTLAAYTRVVEKLAGALGETPEAYRVDAIRAFVLEQTRRNGISKAKQVVTSIRMFLRFLAATKKVPEGLVSSVPTIAGWKLSSLPRFLPAADIDKIIASCDDRTDTALRDRAILLLASRLGLRAGDIAALRFADVDWEAACLRVSGKSRCEVWLPLPQEVGEAILAYLEHERPSVAEQHVFVKAVAPHGAIASYLVSSVVRRAMDRAGIENAPSRGAHVLRHSAATAMLREGATLHQIGSVLRHRSIETTYHYAKLDLDLLGMVVSPWPELREVTPC
jgi:site-specific recombinase XerD